MDLFRLRSDRASRSADAYAAAENRYQSIRSFDPPDIKPGHAAEHDRLAADWTRRKVAGLL